LASRQMSITQRKKRKKKEQEGYERGITTKLFQKYPELFKQRDLSLQESAMPQKLKPMMDGIGYWISFVNVSNLALAAISLNRLNLFK